MRRDLHTVAHHVPWDLSFSPGPHPRGLVGRLAPSVTMPPPDPAPERPAAPAEPPASPERPADVPLAGIDGRPPIPRRLVLAAQHILAAFAGIVAVPLIVGAELGLPPDERALLVSHALLAAGLATAIQTRGLGPIGARLPLVAGTDFTFVAPALQVGRAHGYGAVLGGALLASLVELLLGAGLHRLRRFFPPLVSGVVVLLIGLSLIPVAIDWSLGLDAAPERAPQNLLLALLVAAVAVLLHHFARGFLRAIAVLLAILLGYLLTLLLGWVDLAPVLAAPWIALPRPFHFVPRLDLTFALPFLIAYFVSAMETAGQVLAIGEIAGVRVEGRHLRGGVLADGVASGVVACINAMPTNAYSQNIGLVAISGVTSRLVVLWAAAGMALLAFFPRLGALIAQMPSPILGGAGIVMFGLVAAAGIKMLRDLPWTERDLLIAGLALALGVAAITRPHALLALPHPLQLLLASGISAGGLTVFLLNALLPAPKTPVPTDTQTSSPGPPPPPSPHRPS